MMTKRTILLWLLGATLLAAETDARWAPLEFLVGKWKAEGGSFTLLPELNGQILVRHNFNDRPGQKHEDLMVVYVDGGVKAIDFDTEGHTIRYNVMFPAKDAAVFASEDGKYRLTYTGDRGKVNGKFEADGKVLFTWVAVKE